MTSDKPQQPQREDLEEVVLTEQEAADKARIESLSSNTLQHDDLEDEGDAEEDEYVNEYFKARYMSWEDFEMEDEREEAEIREANEKSDRRDNRSLEDLGVEEDFEEQGNYGNYRLLNFDEREKVLTEAWEQEDGKEKEKDIDSPRKEKDDEDSNQKMEDNQDDDYDPEVLW
ncbi:MAG: hypothetical protein EZS28_008592 [Streblomastix strix]|uniref:Uncharacterized protein n=1 Tax=Streblomastix strix TaxID=222440 RepID=A0A5J4WNU6_9EUKA|nr:MAG: hypothetical protein EZS28_008592 [Streblomastix strix]